MKGHEFLFSTDVEAWGPYPGRYDLAAVGSIVLDYDKSNGTITPVLGGEYYVALRPRVVGWRAYDEVFAVRSVVSAEFDGKLVEPSHAPIYNIDPDSSLVHKLEPNALDMVDQKEGAERYVAWVKSMPRPRVCAIWSTFDWSFLYPWLCNNTGESPFSHSALEMKSLYMGKYGTWWREAIKGEIRKQRPALVADLPPHTHNALDDAREQAELLKRILLDPGDDTGIDQFKRDQFKRALATI